MVYELGSYFQNFRRYVRSYDPARMHDGASSGSPVSACNPFSYLDPSDNGSQALPINPCGQIAQSFFNDSFAFSATAPPPAGAGAAGPATLLAVDSSSIAWSSDADHLYGDVPAENYNPGGAAAPLRGGNTSELPLNKNQHWMVRGWSGWRAGSGRGWGRGCCSDGAAHFSCASPAGEMRAIGCFQPACPCAAC